ncbi:radical SAM protein [uncultured Desulfobacter sp.]|uniref:radical SAM protein n=1 Tax=uncultured Desulfobacter sp. TaxID=240139 RepID=UPI002AAB5788|nr:radical SAM protein [uncultured Desulfobacter sp.]
MMSRDYPFETGVYRPPSEGGSASLLVRFTRNCPWNHCTFCTMYKGKKFNLRSLEEIKSDINAMANLMSDLQAESKALGHGGLVTREAILALLEKAPGLNYHPGADMLIQWMAAGGKTAFLQDGNSMIMPPQDFIEALTYLKQTFPSIERITTYARARTLAQRSLGDLKAIRAAGLDRLHLGLETGDDALLKQIKKGVTADGLIEGGRKAMEAGFQVSEYWMPGLGGKAMTDQHAENTARVLSEINPHYIRSRPFRPARGTSMYDQFKQGQIIMLDPREQLLELRRMIQNLNVTSKVCFDHMGNYWRTASGDLVFHHGYEGYQFPDEKQKVLDRIELGLAFKQEVVRFRHM